MEIVNYPQNKTKFLRANCKERSKYPMVYAIGSLSA
jgi:hypothetical protein